MANWNLPSLTDLYSNFLTYIKARDEDSVRLNDTRVAAPDNPPTYAKRWNDSTQTFQNWWSSVWSDLILGVAGGGTGAATAAGARTNLDVYSKAEADAAFATNLSTEENVLGSGVNLTNASTYYDGPSVSLAAGTWFIVGTLTISIPANYAETIYAKMWNGTDAAYTSGMLQISSETLDRRMAIPLNDIVTLGATTTVKLSAMRTGSGTSFIMATYSNIRALKVA